MNTNTLGNILVENNSAVSLDLLKAWKVRQSDRRPGDTHHFSSGFRKA